jgi:hypothetical protein
MFLSITSRLEGTIPACLKVDRTLKVMKVKSLIPLRSWKKEAIVYLNSRLASAAFIALL